MRPHSRLKHAAGSVLGSFFSRNNDIGGQWALGLLYYGASDSPHTLTLDLIAGTAHPNNTCADLMVKKYKAFLIAALDQQDVQWPDITRAVLVLRFNAQLSDPDFHYDCRGDPVVGSVTLHTTQGRAVTMSARARCFARKPGLFLSLRP